MRQKLTMITLGVADIARAKAFYNGLGWVPSSKSMEDLILYPLGGMLLSLYPRPALAEDAGTDSAGTGFRAVSLSLNAFSKEEVDQVLEEVARMGGMVVKPAQEVFWGGYGGYFTDPDGHLIEVAYNPFWPLDEAGNVVLE